MKTKKTNSVKEVKWFVPLELNHSSYIYTSIIEYCRLEKINFKIASKNLNYKGRVSIENDIEKSSNHVNTKINWVQIKFYNGAKKNIAFDLNDNPNHFGAYALKNADIYYKRCFQESIIKFLSTEHISKIKPMGLPFMVRPNKLRNKNKLKFLFYKFKAYEIFKFDSLLFKRGKLYKTKAVLNFKGFLNTRKISDFKNFESIVSENIFYQKRLFDDTVTQDTKKVNQQRVSVIKVLKSNFPNHFYGGLQRNKLSELEYPELISNVAGDQHSFLKAMKKCGICIYTKGLMDSPGWTLPEYLSQGKCIVAEKLTNEIPYPLINEVHLVYFSNEEELIEICKELLADNKKRDFLGNNARQYYEKYITPSIFFYNLLNTDFE
ncbi:MULTISPECIES: glycosyltransferase [Aequorivita]|uniref:Glycosyltransferase family 1 protein n=1 Tax=Aequorivita iocasae TaxID=2803865 RepID=A0ABX7DVK3_9FLAO|nr:MULTISPECIES: glycosyltransferase [Aequorivita]QQX76789.1 glycosyltransferase family 1 protein [Aequorivita iocasae]UCA56261.1 glycosyltransferase [Aequorivita sp. F7]